MVKQGGTKKNQNEAKEVGREREGGGGGRRERERERGGEGGGKQRTVKSMSYTLISRLLKMFPSEGQNTSQRLSVSTVPHSMTKTTTEIKSSKQTSLPRIA